MLTNYRRRSNTLSDAYQTAKMVYRGGRAVGKSLRNGLSNVRRRKGMVGKTKSSLQRKIQGPSRRLPYVRKERQVQNETGGGYHQWTVAKKNDTLSKALTSTQRINRQLKLAQEKLILRWNGIKDFDNNGFYWLDNRVVGARRYLPCYAFDLTSCVNATTNGNVLNAAPMAQLFLDTGAVFFESVNTVNYDGTTFSSGWNVERASYSTSGGSLVNVLPHNKDILKWLDVRMNCWGAKSRSTKYTIQIVRFKDDALVPTPLVTANEKRTDLFQSILKPYCYNPIAMTGGIQRKNMKVLRSETFVIQPTSTTETDTDGHVKTLKWFLKFDRLLDYAQKSSYITSNIEVADAADFALNTGLQNDAYVAPSKRLYLMVYASNYGDDVTPSPTDTPSMDLSIRACHTVFT